MRSVHEVLTRKNGKWYKITIQISTVHTYSTIAFSAIWHCWLGVGKSIRPVKNDWWGVGVVISVCSEVRGLCMRSSGYRWHLIISCFIKTQIGLTFLVPACPGCHEKENVKRVSMSVPSQIISWCFLLWRYDKSVRHTPCRSQHNYKLVLRPIPKHIVRMHR